MARKDLDQITKDGDETKPDYKNWMPKGMVLSGLAATAVFLILFIVFGLTGIISGTLKTVLVIAHRMRTIEAADQIVVLADGRVVEKGTPSELLAKEDSMFRRMTSLQAVNEEWTITKE